MLTLATACLLLAATAPAGGEKWMTDFEKAKAMAKAQGKDLLIDFTGSDWCGWCIKLKQEVFDTAEFGAAAGKHFVLVELDFPRKTELPEELRKQNARLQQEFAVQGFPTILLTDADGKPYGKTGYQPGGPAAYLIHLETLREAHTTRDAAWNKAKGVQGVERAKHLEAGLKALSPEFYRHYGKVIGQIVELDADDGAGLKSTWGGELAKIKTAAQLQKIMARVQELAEAGDWSTVVSEVGAFLDTHEVGPQQNLTLLSAQLKGLEETKDFAGAIAVLGKIKQLAPHAAEEIDEMIADFENKKAAKAKGGDDK